MQIEFYKYQGAGNDFILLNNFAGKYDSLSNSQISDLCNRRFGIGADGLIKINKQEESDFEMEYFNADGSKSFCGNGARCSVRFVNDNLLKKDSYLFMAIDGLHDAQIQEKNISLEMKQVSNIDFIDKEICVLDTGSPHYIKFEKNIHEIDITSFGRSVRNNETYFQNGINVNLVEISDKDTLAIRTYERGVEEETLSCGTGITAAAIAYAHKMERTGNERIYVKALGGNLVVEFYSENAKDFSNIRLIGPAEFVFKGEINV